MYDSRHLAVHRLSNFAKTQNQVSHDPEANQALDPAIRPVAQAESRVVYPSAQPSTPQPQSIRVVTPQGTVEKPNIKYHALYTPNDIKSAQWFTTKIAAPATWDKTTGSSDTAVAVIDTGFALSHDELSYRWETNSGEMGTVGSEGAAPNCTSRGLPLDKSCNNIDDDSNGYVDDWRGWDYNAGDNTPQAGTQSSSGSVTHGTNTSGLVGAAGNNNIGAVSLNWQTKILPLQALDDTGTGYTSAIAQAMHYAVDRGVDVISLSLGSNVPDDVMRVELDYAAANNVVVVAAAGNDGCDCLSYPANYSDVIAVGATDANDAVASFSSYGANLDVVAPGSGLISTTTWTSTNNQSAYTSGNIYGTSFSAPIVAGLAALLKGVRPDATPAMINSWITGGTDVINSNRAGSGRINTYKSLLLATPNPINVTPVRSTPVYKLTKTGKDPMYTSSYDRKEDLRYNQSYTYSIMRFAPY